MDRPIVSRVEELDEGGDVCAGEMVAGWLLWQRRRPGVVLAYALLPFELIFWIGFALPFGPILGADGRPRS
jgi:hypothetical protein